MADGLNHYFHYICHVGCILVIFVSFIGLICLIISLHLSPSLSSYSLDFWEQRFSFLNALNFEA
ncbi:hypothetical protein ACE6H2_026993 [Prunus campanulata]